MMASYRVLGCLLLLTAVLLGLGVLQTGWVRSTTDERKDSLYLSSVLLSPPGAEVIASSKRSAARAQIVKQVRKGEMSLFAAASWFGVINEEMDGNGERVLANFAGRCDNERLCRQVISWVEASLQTSGELPSPLLLKMEQELSEHIARHGKVILDSVD